MADGGYDGIVERDPKGKIPGAFGEPVTDSPGPPGHVFDRNCAMAVRRTSSRFSFGVCWQMR
jgi:hypothetical protein